MKGGHCLPSGMGAGSGHSLVAQPQAVPVAGSRGCQGDLEASLAPSTGPAPLDRPRNQPRASPQLSILSPSHPEGNSKERTEPCMAEHT